MEHTGRAYSAKKRCDFVIPYRTLPGVGGGGPDLSGLRDFRRFLKGISSKVGPPEAEIFEDLGRCFKQKTRSKCTLERIFPVKTPPHHPKFPACGGPETGFSLDLYGD